MPYSSVLERASGTHKYSVHALEALCFISLWCLGAQRKGMVINMERMRTLAFQVPDSLFQRVKAYLERNHMTQKQFVIGLIEAELEQDEAQYQASHPEEQEDEGESDDQAQDEETEQEIQEESQDEFAPQEAQDGPEGTTRPRPGRRPRGRF